MILARPVATGTASDCTIIDGAIYPRTDRRHHAIPQPRHGRDVSGLFGVVAEQTAERGHRLIDRILTDGDVRPDLAEQIIDTDDLARTFGEALQQAHRSRFNPRGFSVPGNLAGRRIDAPRADAKHCGGCVLHTESTLRLCCSIKIQRWPIVSTPWTNWRLSQSAARKPSKRRRRRISG